MRKYVLLLIVPLMLLNCSKDENGEDVSASQTDDFFILSELVAEDLSAVNARSSQPGATADNPIVVSSDTFIDHVKYPIDICNFGVNEDFPVERFQGLFYGLPRNSVSSAPSIYRLTSDGCYVQIPNDQVSSDFNTVEFQFGLFYEIFGVTVRLSDPFSRTRGFWFTDIEDSDQVSEVTFTRDGSITFGTAIDFPYGTDLDCSNTIDFPSGSYVVTQFPEGQRAVREFNGQNFLYVSTGLGFNFTGTCGSGNSGGGEPTIPEEVQDICENVPDFVRFTRYKRGDQVVFMDYLFTKTSRSWRREGKCGI